MVLSFVNKNIRELCEDEDIANELLGEELAKKLHARLADLLVIDCVSNLINIKVGSPEEIKNEEIPKYKINLSSRNILVFCAVNVPIDKIDWSQVKRIKILEIRNTNE